MWKKEPWTYRFDTHPNDAKHRLIGRCEQVIVDGRLLTQVDRLDEMPPGSFFADTDHQILYVRLASDRDPNQASVEASVRAVCFGPGWGGERRDYITVRGLIIRHAANMAQRGALFAQGDHWTIEDCVVEHTNGTGVSFHGDYAALRRVSSRHNGQQGLSGDGRHFVLEEVALEHNNVKGFDKDWEGGGMKIAVARDGVVRRCRAVANNGVGLWFDIDVRNVVVEHCFCSENAGHGIFVEISGGFTIRNNLCIGNGTDDAWGQAGIAIGESDHTTIENNTCVLNPTGITLREIGPREFRGIDRERVSYHVHDVTVRRNVCALNRRYQIGLWWDNPFFGPHPTPSVGAKGIPLDPVEANLRFDENCYWMEGMQQLALWGCPWRKGHLTYSDLAAWQTARGQDAHSLAANPQFVTPSKGDWSLAAREPREETGSRPLRGDHRYHKQKRKDPMNRNVKREVDRTMKTQHGLRWTLPVIVAASLLGTPTVRATGATLSLVQDGNPVYAVVVPDGDDAVAMSAATMLAGTVEKPPAAIGYRASDRVAPRPQGFHRQDARRREGRAESGGDAGDRLCAQGGGRQPFPGGQRS